MDIRLLAFIIWMLDIFNIDIVYGNFSLDTFLDVTVPLNFWFWLVFWLLCPSCRNIIIGDK